MEGFVEHQVAGGGRRVQSGEEVVTEGSWGDNEEQSTAIPAERLEVCEPSGGDGDEFVAEWGLICSWKCFEVCVGERVVWVGGKCGDNWGKNGIRLIAG